LNGDTSERKRKAFQILASMGAVIAMFLLITVPIFMCVRPRGERVAVIALSTMEQRIEIPASKGNRLHFRMEVTPGGKQLRSNLAHSTIHLRLTQGKEQTHRTCSGYSGVARATNESAITGIVLKCLLYRDAQQAATLHAKATWGSGPVPKQAWLEIRAEE
jgi:hypothetical protein